MVTKHAFVLMSIGQIHSNREWIAIVLSDCLLGPFSRANKLPSKNKQARNLTNYWGLLSLLVIGFSLGDAYAESPDMKPDQATVTAKNAAPVDTQPMFHPIEDIRTQVTEAISRHDVWNLQPKSGQVMKIEPQGLERLQLRPCEMPLSSEINATDLRPRAQVMLRCESPLWSINIPVEISLFGKVAALKTSLPKGARVSEAHLDWVEQNLLALGRGYYTDSQGLIGQVAKRSLAPGVLLTPYLLEPAQVIVKGDDVMIMARTPFLQVRMPGEALSDGRMGRQVSVKNRQSELVVRGTVIAPGLVEVTF